MHVDSSVELERDDPALEVPWSSEDNELRYYDLRNHPTLIDEVQEVKSWPEMREFLLRVNSLVFPLQSAKSDLWTTNELSAEEEVFAAQQKFASYVDLIFAEVEARCSLEGHQELIRKLTELLKRAPDIPAMIEFVLRRCYYHSSPDANACEGDDYTGFCITAYTSGFGDSGEEARQRWGIALKLLQHALVQSTRA
ncbi:MAG TPA: hypothetical protein VN669_02795 [Candidatus Acidoferrales bacterium]|jgi:hypothetical protein|nr:hypothetical protein [Candidatus Acidoferrales bacterium]